MRRTLASLVGLVLAGCVTFGSVPDNTGTSSSSSAASSSSTPPSRQSMEKPHLHSGTATGVVWGTPYEVLGQKYWRMESVESFVEEGMGSWYGPGFHGKRTSNGEKYDMDAMTAAHRTLPLGSIVRVENRQNGREIVVRINDRGPFVKDRIIDLSRKGAEKLGYLDDGTAPVRITLIGNEKKKIDTNRGTVSFGDGSFFVQIAAFADRTSAEDLVSRLDRHARISVEAGFYRVQVGPFTFRDRAESWRDDAQHRFPGAFVIVE